ncbi:MAG: hypothetical protein R3F59_14845 [Myxococcota bacterium]
MTEMSGLPAVVLVDTGVLIRGLGHQPNDPLSPVCTTLLQFLFQNRRVLISALSLVEIQRGTPKTGAAPVPIPHTPKVAVVAFDTDCANVCGRLMPHEKLLEIKSQTGLFVSYLKYDSLIVASAIRWGASMIVSADTGMQRRHGELIPICHPQVFDTRQGVMFHRSARTVKDSPETQEQASQHPDDDIPF